MAEPEDVSGEMAAWVIQLTDTVLRLQREGGALQKKLDEHHRNLRPGLVCWVCENAQP